MAPLPRLPRKPSRLLLSSPSNPRPAFSRPVPVTPPPEVVVGWSQEESPTGKLLTSPPGADVAAGASGGVAAEAPLSRGEPKRATATAGTISDRARVAPMNGWTAGRNRLDAALSGLADEMRWPVLAAVEGEGAHFTVPFVAG